MSPDQLTTLRAAGALSALDQHLATTLGRLAGEERPEVLLALALVSRAAAAGHVRLDLARLEGLRSQAGEPLRLERPELSHWIAALRASPLVGRGDPPTPLVLEERRYLYLHRLWDRQRRLADQLWQRVQAPPPTLDTEELRRDLERLFPQEAGTSEPDLQRLAAFVAARGRLAVISGGPGTGKTTTVLRILALLQLQALACGQRPLRCLLLAPTGKAAARLSESLRRGLPALPVPQAIRDSIPLEATTIHRALGARMRGMPRFRHGPQRPLPADVVVTDEASMIDLSLMCALAEAVPAAARLVLLGDRSQLASVEAGAILGDLCNLGGQPRGRSSGLQRAAYELGGVALPVEEPAPCGMQDCVVRLQRSYRFAAGGGIAALARAIDEGDAASAEAQLLNPQQGELRWTALAEGDGLDQLLERELLDELQAPLQAESPAQALRALERRRVLCAHHRGRLGVQRVNQRVRQLLAARGQVPAQGEWYAGRPVMVTRNEHSLQLYNGDLGLALERTGELRVHFSAPDGGTRAIHPARLPPCATAYAMTVHKSQGSEFQRVLLLLSTRVSPIMTRELLYTGITRARKQVWLAGSPEVLRAAIRRRVRRGSGLREALWEVAA